MRSRARKNTCTNKLEDPPEVSKMKENGQDRDLEI
jgi:hypothetical protein